MRKTIGLALLLALGMGAPVWGQQSPKPLPSLTDLLRTLSAAPAETCFSERDFGEAERQFLQQADNAVIRGLNNGSDSSPAARATNALAEVERLSAQINSSWPDESRFHSEVVDIPPAVIVVISYRDRETFSFFAIPEIDYSSKPTHLWQTNGLDPGRYKSLLGFRAVSVEPLARGPSGKARLLVGSFGAGCAGSVSVGYSAYEWDPEGPGRLEEIIKLEGAESQDDPVDEHIPSDKIAVDSFPPIGTRQTEGARIKLPYCWFSAIDTWDNPSLCAVDTYDISGDRPRFISTVYNRPDILPIARVLQYAGTHDYLALRAYCGSDEVAQQLLEDVPPSAGAEQLSVLRTGESREIVKYGEENSYSFEVEKTGDRWVVVSFQMD